MKPGAFNSHLVDTESANMFFSHKPRGFPIRIVLWHEKCAVWVLRTEQTSSHQQSHQTNRTGSSTLRILREVCTRVVGGILGRLLSLDQSFDWFSSDPIKILNFHTNSYLHSVNKNASKWWSLLAGAFGMDLQQPNWFCSKTVGCHRLRFNWGKISK